MQYGRQQENGGENSGSSRRQNALGADMSADLNNADYAWDENGRLSL